MARGSLAGLLVVVVIATSTALAANDARHVSGSIQFTAKSATPESNMANDNYSNVFILCQEGSTLPDCET